MMLFNNLHARKKLCYYSVDGINEYIYIMHSHEDQNGSKILKKKLSFFFSIFTYCLKF